MGQSLKCESNLGTIGEAMFIRRKNYTNLIDEVENLKGQNRTLENQVTDRDRKIDNFQKQWDEQNDQISDLVRELESLKEERDLYKELYDSVDNTITEESELSSVEVRIDHKLQKATPIIRLNTSVIDALIDEGYMTFAQSDDNHAIQLALAVVANEVLTQIISAFEPDPVEFDNE